jgi:hypothetical protein
MLRWCSSRAGGFSSKIPFGVRRLAFGEEAKYKIFMFLGAPEGCLRVLWDNKDGHATSNIQHSTPNLQHRTSKYGKWSETALRLPAGAIMPAGAGV